MAFPVTSVLDNFNRANEGPPPSASWSGPIFVGDDQLVVRSNGVEVQASAAGSDYWNTSFGADQEVYTTVVVNIASGVDIWGRVASPNTSSVDGYTVNAYGPAGGIRIFRVDNGTYTQLGATITQSFSDGDSIGMTIIGDTITAYYKVGAGAWANIGSRTDGTYTAGGFIGLRMESGVACDNFGGGSIVSALGWGVPKLGTLVEDATGNFDLIEPAGVANGDLMVACIAYRGNAAITRPAGWEVVATQQNSGDTDATNGIASGCMFYIVRGSSAPALTCTRTAGDVVLARVISYSGGSRFPYDTGSANTLGSASATVTTGTITTAEAGELLVAMTAAGDTYLASAFDATDPSTASGATDTTTAPTAGTWIERQDSSTGTGADTGLAIADAIKATAGATGTIQATIAGSAQHVMIVGAFKVAPALGRIYMSRQAVMRSNLF